MKRCKSRYVVTLLGGWLALVPALGSASSELHPHEPTFFAFSSMDKLEALALEPLQPEEMQEVQGEFFNLVFNFAFVPQINICVFCFDVNQSNFAMVLGNNNLP